MNDLHQLIIRLKKHNQWRRGEIELTQEELNPKQIGQDIDDAINYLEFLAEKHKWLAAQVKKYSNKYELI